MINYVPIGKSMLFGVKDSSILHDALVEVVVKLSNRLVRRIGNVHFLPTQGPTNAIRGLNSVQQHRVFQAL